MTSPCPQSPVPFSSTAHPALAPGATASTKVILTDVVVAAIADEANDGDSSRAAEASMARNSRFMVPPWCRWSVGAGDGPRRVYVAPWASLFPSDGTMRDIEQSARASLRDRVA